LQGIDRLEALLAAGDREGVIEVFAREIVRMSPSEFERLRVSPAWPARLAAAHTLPRELRAVDDFRIAAVEPQRIAIPALLLLGSDSPANFGAAIERLASALPQARTTALAGQRHVAMDTAPELLARKIVEFWTEVGRG
jgi:pimeloyl-ACP methyl ester carboxylesterase